MVVLVGAGLLLPNVPALAEGDSGPVGIVVRQEDGSQAREVRIAGLYPTAARQVVFLLDGAAAEDARRLRLTVENLVDRENDCLAPEVREGDSACGRVEGDLSGWIGVTVTAGRAEGAGCAPAGRPVATTLRAMATEPVVVGLPDHRGRLCVIADLRHGEGVGDDVTQSDSVGFDLWLDLDGRTVAAAGSPGGAGPPAVAAAVLPGPAVVQRGDVVDLGPVATAPPMGPALLLGGLVLGGCTAVLLGFRRRSGLGS